jgi:hypothetical protein
MSKRWLRRSPRAGDRLGTRVQRRAADLSFFLYCLKRKAKERIDPNNSDIIRVSQRHADSTVRLHIIRNAQPETSKQTSPCHRGHINRRASLPNGFFLMIVLYCTYSRLGSACCAGDTSHRRRIFSPTRLIYFLRLSRSGKVAHSEAYVQVITSLLRLKIVRMASNSTRTRPGLNGPQG